MSESFSPYEPTPEPEQVSMEEVIDFVLKSKIATQMWQSLPTAGRRLVGSEPDIQVHAFRYEEENNDVKLWLWMLPPNPGDSSAGFVRNLLGVESRGRFVPTVEYEDLPVKELYQLVRRCPSFFHDDTASEASED